MVQAGYQFQWFAFRQINAKILTLVNQLFQLSSARHVCSIQRSLGLSLKLFHTLLQLLETCTTNVFAQ